MEFFKNMQEEIGKFLNLQIKEACKSLPVEDQIAMNKLQAEVMDVLKSDLSAEEMQAKINEINIKYQRKYGA